MIENIVNKLLQHNLLWRSIGKRRKLTSSMTSDLQLMIDYAEKLPGHYSSIKLIFDNRIRLYEYYYWNVKPFKGYL